MRLSVRAFRPGAVVSSFLGVLDIKLGCEIVLLFGLINKVAGVYGLITILVGGTFLQYAFYAYSVATLFAFLWALKVVKSESASPALLVAHLYTLDHAIVSLFHYGFYAAYWALPHDGRRTVNSAAQQALIDLAVSRGEVADPSSGGETDAHRARLAGEVWRDERGFALAVLAVGWLVKVYFVVLIYSYAAHLRQSTYHTLPTTSRAKATQIAHPTTAADLRAAGVGGLDSQAGSRRASAASVGTGAGEVLHEEHELALAERIGAEDAGPENGAGVGAAGGKGKGKGKGRGREGEDSGSDWE